MNFLIDTNVASELGRPKPDRRVVDWADGVGTSELHLSVLTLGEIAKGAAKLKRRDAVAANALYRWLEGLRRHYADRIIAIDANIAEAWGQLASGRSVPVIDALLAATALVHGLTLVTRNERDIADLGVPILNLWDF